MSGHARSERLPVWVRASAWCGPAAVAVYPFLWATGATMTVAAGLGTFFSLVIAGMWGVAILGALGVGKLVTGAALLAVLVFSLRAGVVVALRLILLLSAVSRHLATLPRSALGGGESALGEVAS
ncbi:Uncharacterised protein (plasmid) [Tsukamurella tyrosinosolvens]|uniref:Uncharacterized protein n=1 Tax=Tsukamurella tyrosinosolvens TaxID=57704 RepID=A0A1H4VN09_TSUTY|nr:hypothetical protein AXK58_21145 [Tsukamurella tyrosinosolvens]SEC81958.1 hypothetical protein SAMN04489793_3269 [Tsukamurella tyrosinosolvens]VEH90436.1 Uncharacterised protein [Tsukamurella tyrosinosolvens]